MKSSALRSMEWILAASAALFFVFGRYVAPYYEGMFAQMAPEEEPVRIGVYSLWLAGILVIALIGRLFWRFKKR